MAVVEYLIPDPNTNGGEDSRRMTGIVHVVVPEFIPGLRAADYDNAARDTASGPDSTRFTCAHSAGLARAHAGPGPHARSGPNTPCSTARNYKETRGVVSGGGIVRYVAALIYTTAIPERVSREEPAAAGIVVAACQKLQPRLLICVIPGSRAIAPRLSGISAV
ncbi:MAG TPA: hypothetical protein VFJ58_20325 [Armatimonadota bacterium]|nr:hypothetical protein [Armatimonadota bacterium]